MDASTAIEINRQLASITISEHASFEYGYRTNVPYFIRHMVHVQIH